MNLISREHLLQRISNPESDWDLLVIGGGATGLGIALESVTRGYKTLLVEQADFAKGTSSRSTKLIHGGVRYLAQGNIKLVREASVERGRLFRNAPHLVKNQTFIIPIYSQWEKCKYITGLKIYDWISGTLSLGSSVHISRKETIEALPGISTHGLIGGIRYHDGQFDDARLAISLVQTVLEKGGCALNYAKVAGLIKDKKGVIQGASITDVESNTSYQLKAKAVVNATGVFVDDILQMDNVSAQKSICVSQGVHVVLDKKFFPSAHALMIPETSDGRVLFAVPWHGKVVIGTTDTPVKEPSLEPAALKEEIDFILNTAGTYLAKRPTKADIVSVFAGLRPLAAPKQGRQKTKEISRSHKIIVSPSQLFTIIGGKWTTFRIMGEEMVNQIETKLSWPRQKSVTAALPLYGHAKTTDWHNPLYVYGSDAPLLTKEIKDHPDQWISKPLKIHKAQVKWAIEQEMARTVEDVLARRTRALFLDAKESIRIAPEVAKAMAALLGRGEGWIQNEIKQFTELAKQYLVSPGR